MKTIEAMQALRDSISDRAERIENLLYGETSLNICQQMLGERFSEMNDVKTKMLIKSRILWKIVGDLYKIEKEAIATIGK